MSNDFLMREDANSLCLRYIDTQAHRHTNTRMHTLHTHAHTHTHTHTHTHSRTHTHTHRGRSEKDDAIERDFRLNTLLPASFTWSEADQATANAEWEVRNCGRVSPHPSWISSFAGICVHSFVSERSAKPGLWIVDSFLACFHTLSFSHDLSLSHAHSFSFSLSFALWCTYTHIRARARALPVSPSLGKISSEPVRQSCDGIQHRRHYRRSFWCGGILPRARGGAQRGWEGALLPLASCAAPWSPWNTRNCQLAAYTAGQDVEGIHVPRYVYTETEEKRERARQREREREKVIAGKRARRDRHRHAQRERGRGRETMWGAQLESEHTHTHEHSGRNRARESVCARARERLCERKSVIHTQIFVIIWYTSTYSHTIFVTYARGVLCGEWL